MAEQEWETYHSKFEQIDRLFLLLVKVAEESGTNFMTMATAILEAGYRLPGGKAPLLTDEEIDNLEWTETPAGNYAADFSFIDDYSKEVRVLLKAQNDADNKWFGGKE